jgi:hypothetical protein
MKLSPRTDPTAAASLLKELCPSELARRAWAELVANSVGTASAVSPMSWELSVFPSLVRLNVGQISVLELWEREVVIYIHGNLANEATRGYKQFADWSDYSAVPRVNQRWSVSLKALPSLSTKFRSAHHRLVELAASNKPRSPFMRAHSPGMVAVVETLTQIRLPEHSCLQEEQEFESSLGYAEENREIECLAVEAVTCHYASTGWLVKSVERDRRGFDLICQKARKELHVEVKGASAQTDCFFLTAGEFGLAFSDDAFVLALVDGIVESPRIRLWPAKALRRLFDFEAVQYRARLKSRVTPASTGRLATPSAR